jgi:hypothetical protein
MIAVVDPQASRRRDGGRRRCPGCGSTSRDEQKRQTSPSLPPKGANRGPPTFSPANGRFQGPRQGPRCPIADPSGPAPFLRLAPPWWWGEGHAPVVAVLLARASQAPFADLLQAVAMLDEAGSGRAAGCSPTQRERLSRVDAARVQRLVRVAGERASRHEWKAWRWGWIYYVFAIPATALAIAATFSIVKDYSKTLAAALAGVRRF